MKPKDFKSPFRFADRRPLLQERVLFIPTHYDKHREWVFPGFQEVFQNDHPVLIEYCSGNGDWVIAKAMEFPQWNWVAVEKRFDRVRKIWSKMNNCGVNNLLIVSGEALTFNKEYLPPSCVEEVFINFPDPWPKRGHAKHRLIQDVFVTEIARIVKQGGNATLVTDDPDYSVQIIEVMRKSCQWKSHFKEPYFVTDWPNYGNSFFCNLWKAKGFTIHYHQFIRTP